MAVKSPTVTLAPGGKQFQCMPERSILDSGLSAGVALPFHCSNGSCGDCRATVLSGEIRKIKRHDFVLSEAEKISGLCLMCSNTAVSDLVLEVTEATSVADIPEQELKAKRCRLELLDNVMIVGFKFVRARAFRFLSGQRANLRFPSGQTADLPIASCPCNAQFVEFHLPSTGINAEIYALTTALTSVDRVVITGPVGDFTLSSNPRKPKLFIAIGEGFASVQGLIEQLFNLGYDTPCTLLWLASDSVRQYRHNLCRSWADAMDEFSYIPAEYGSDVLQVLTDSAHINRDNIEVYISAAAVDSALLKQQLTQSGVGESDLFINLLQEPPD